MTQQSARLTLGQIASWTQGELLGADANKEVLGVAFDSRKLTPGALFIALVAERDGHDYLPAALEAGAAAALISNPAARPPQLPAIIVPDTLYALGQLAAAWRNQFNVKLAGVTGSNGKTTCKEMLGRITACMGPTLRTEGNLNNLIGLPVTLLGLNAEHQYAILEMGMNVPGEIARLAEIAQPEVGVITCVAAAHLEGLGSIEGVARAKGELFAALTPDSTAVINADDPHVLALQKGLNCRRIFFTSLPHKQTTLPPGSPTVTLESCESLGTKGFQITVRRPIPQREGILVVEGRTETFSLHLPLVGRHQVSNALAAIATATALGVSEAAIIEGLRSMQPTGRRMRVVETAHPIHMLDDCYNSNPNSARAALQTLRDLSPQNTRIAVLGDMLELGKDADAAHANIGRCCAALGVTRLFAFGPLSKNTATAAVQAGIPAENVFHSTDIDALWDALQPHLTPHTWVLIKGSRGMRLERISERVETLPTAT